MPIETGMYDSLKQPQTSLADMVNMARGMQAYQKQAATMGSEINTAKAIASKAGTEADIAAQTKQPKIEQSASEAKLAKIQAAKAGAFTIADVNGRLHQGIYDENNGTVSFDAGTVLNSPKVAYTPGEQITSQTVPEFVKSDLTKKHEVAALSGTRIGVYSNIDDVAKKAALGQYSDKLTYLNGLLGALGDKAALSEAEANQKLNKEQNMLILNSALGGNTDATRSLLSGMTPGAKVNYGAVHYNVSQSIAQERLNQIKAQHADRFATNPTEYIRQNNILNSLDPRALQWSEMNLQDKQKMKQENSSNPTVDNSFRQSLDFLRSNGYMK